VHHLMLILFCKSPKRLISPKRGELAHFYNCEHYPTFSNYPMKTWGLHIFIIAQLKTIAHNRQSKFTHNLRMASIRQLKIGFRAEVCVNRVRDSATFDSRTQAKAWAAKRETELRDLARGKFPDHSLKFVVERYIKEISPTKKGSYKEISALNAFLRDYKTLNKLSIARITTDDLGTWRDERLKIVSAATVKREVSILSSIFNTARIEWKWISSNPFADLRLPPVAAHRDRRLSQDEIERICTALKYTLGTPITLMSQQVAITFLLALETAMRAGEIRGLTWDRVNLDQRYVRLIETKNGSKRDVALSLKAVSLLKQMQGVDPKKVFNVSDGLFVTLFRKARDLCKIENLHFHDTRHEACTRLAQKLQMLDLARMIGHKDPRSLMIYYNATASEIAARLD
jgi:integrase